MNTKQKTNWWIDLVIFAGFITTFFLNLTGVIVHQWIGLLSGVLAVLHFFLHLDWVERVSIRLFGKTSWRMRIYYALDVLLLMGFSGITFTGLVISTWLNLPLSNFTIWLNIHIIVSISALLVLLLKLVLHWRWISHFARNILSGPAAAPAKRVITQPVKAASDLMGRRQFLQVAGVVGGASFLALLNASKGLAGTAASSEDTAVNESAATTEVSAATEATATMEATPTTAATATTEATATSEATATTEVVATQAPVTNTQSTTNQSAAFSSSTACTVRCNRNCSYPGHCRRYVDTNNNNRCDLSECI